MIGYAFVGAVVVLPSLLVCWARYHDIAAAREHTARVSDDVAEPG